jgi:hypothetical protein
MSKLRTNVGPFFENKMKLLDERSNARTLVAERACPEEDAREHDEPADDAHGKWRGQALEERQQAEQGDKRAGRAGSTRRVQHQADPAVGGGGSGVTRMLWR